MDCPTISIVTPNLNLATYLDRTIASVVGQGYPKLEYIVIDGGSSDGSVDVIKRYEPHLAYWAIRPNKGQYATINEGFDRSTGEIMAWINSDDMYLPGALSVVGEIFSRFPQVEWLTTTQPALWNEQGQLVGAARSREGYSRKLFLRGENGPVSHNRAQGWIQQESTFWRRSLWQKSGAHLDLSVTLAADFELWARFFQCAELYGVHALLAGFRLRSGQITNSFLRDYNRQCSEVLARYGGRICGRTESLLRRCGMRLPVLKSLLGTGGLGLMFPVKSFAHGGRGNNWTLHEAMIL